MKEVLVDDLIYSGVAHLFDPPGIRMLQKSTGAEPTTTILVRGGAGVGKTTMGLALAHAIARKMKGMVLFVATEASFADVIYKARILGIDNDIRPTFERGEEYGVGTIGLVHAAINEDDSPVQDESPQPQLAERAMQLAFDAVKYRVEHAMSAPIRAVLLDGLELMSPNADVSRQFLITYLQALESYGVSPLFVQEADDFSSQRLMFAVDLVFQLAWSHDERGEISRKLSIPKCRYSHATAGPFDLTFHDSLPTVWPDLNRLDFGEKRRPVGFLWPHGGFPEEFVVVPGGALVVLELDKSQRVLASIRQSPRAHVGFVRCGPTIEVVDDALETAEQWPADLGPMALGWRLRHVLRRLPTNILIWTGVDYLLSLPGFSKSLPILFDRLRHWGFLVVVNVGPERFVPITSIADFVSPWTPIARKNSRLMRIIRPYRSGRVLPLTILQTWFDRDFQALFDQALSIEAQLGKQTVPAVRTLMKKFVDPENCGHFPPRIVLALAWLYHRIGCTSVADGLTKGVRDRNSSTDTEQALAGWLYGAMGNFSGAFSYVAGELDRPSPNNLTVRLWHTLRCYYLDTDVIELQGPEWNHVLQEPFIQELRVRQSLVTRLKTNGAIDVTSMEGAGGEGLSNELPIIRLRHLVTVTAILLQEWNNNPVLSSYAHHIVEQIDEFVTRSFGDIVGVVSVPDDVALEFADLCFNCGQLYGLTGNANRGAAFHRLAKTVNPYLEVP